ncbi:MAG: hypothetical protein KDE19_12820 [Caldilineaceae bacterium]|nr:hypothetical protein [Caldilineaceae bacterium]
MTYLPDIHDRLTNSAVIFIAVIGVWAAFLRLRGQPLNASWFGAAIVGELLLVAQVLIGTYLYLGMGLGAVLPRPFLHILYGIVAIITLPAAYGYFGQLEDENVKTVALAATCFFLWGILLRAAQVAQFG